MFLYTWIWLRNEAGIRMREQQHLLGDSAIAGVNQSDWLNMVAHTLLKQNALSEENHYANIIYHFPKEHHRRGGLFMKYSACK